MASEQIATDGRRHRHRRRSHRDSGRPHDEDPHRQPIDATFEKPTDIAALREARLKSMATPAIARNKMKMERDHITPVKRPAAARSTHTIRASGLFGPRTPILHVRSRSTATENKRRDEQADDGQYVYRDTNSSGIDRRDFQKEHDREVKHQRKTAERRQSTGPQPGKPQIERRKTEPASGLRRTSTVAATARPLLRKSRTSTKAIETENAEEFAGMSNRTDTVVSNAKSTKGQQSFLGALFGKPPPMSEKQVSCLTCGSDDVPRSKSAKLPCSHRMCHTCLRRIFKMSIKDPAHMPPRCCTEQHIDLKHVDSLFDQDFKKVWNRKFKEYNAKNRIYCPRRGCGEWIQPKHMRLEQGRKIAVCPKCHLAVCSICNQKAHKSRECPKDPAMKQLSEIAEQQGWRKCFNCSAMVELKEGCNHMTCRCTAEFCMVCGLKWKSCDCPWFSYDAVNDLRGDPVRYQQELDRRREQMLRDEEIARQMAGVGPGNQNHRRAVHVVDYEADNAAGNNMNANFLRQAREALTANYATAEVAARGILGGWFNGQENAQPADTSGNPGGQIQIPHQHQAPFDPPLGRRRTYRVRNMNAGRES